MFYSLLKSATSTFVITIGIITSVLAGDIVLNLEEPGANSTYTGIANVRGWVVGSKGINRVELYVNGELKNNIPIGGLRTDVGHQYPNYPNSSHSGYSMAFNYSDLPAGQHSIIVRAIDSEGSFKDSSATFNVTRFDNSYISNSSSVSLNGATISNNNQSIIISNMTADGKKYDIRLDWRTATQGYTITQIIPTGGGVATGFLNDTGIDWCANDTTNNLACPVASHRGQDGEHGRDALARAGQLQKVGGGAAGFDFTKLDANGNALPASATRWDCVRDNHTGLVWEVKTTSGLRDWNHTYTWYNPDPTTNGGSAGIQNGGNCTGSTCDTHGFVQAVNQQGLCGASDWRLPTRRELMSIVHNGRFNPAIDTAYFPNPPSLGWFWSSSPYAGDSDGDGDGDGAWLVAFYGGHVNSSSKSYDGYGVRLVRTGQ